MKIESFDHIHIYSKDPEEASKFYKQFLNGKEIYRKERAGGLRIYLSLSGRIIVIGPFPSNREYFRAGNLEGGAHQHRIGLDHFGVRVKDLKSAIQELREGGVQILAEPVSGSSGISYAFIAAPDGVIIELTQYGLLPKVYLKLKNFLK